MACGSINRIDRIEVDPEVSPLPLRPMISNLKEMSMLTRNARGGSYKDMVSIRDC
jgi:hypothetical protein